MATSFIDTDIRATLAELRAELCELQSLDRRVRAVTVALRRRSEALVARIGALEQRMLTQSVTRRTRRRRHDA